MTTILTNEIAKMNINETVKLLLGESIVEKLTKAA